MCKLFDLGIGRHPVSSVALAVNRHEEVGEHRLDGQDKVRKFLSQNTPLPCRC